MNELDILKSDDTTEALLKIQGEVEPTLPKESETTEVIEEAQKVEPVKEEVKQATEEVVVEKTTDKKQKISELINAKRLARTLSKELGDVQEEVIAEEVQNTQPVVQKMTDEEREQLLAEAEARAEAKLKPQLDEALKLKQENELFKREETITKLKTFLSKEVKDFVKEYPHAKMMIDEEYLANLVISNEKNANYTPRDLILNAYPNITQAPKMDSYGAQSRNAPAEIDFANMSEEELTQMEKNPKMAEQYARYVGQFLR